MREKEEEQFYLPQPACTDGLMTLKWMLCVGQQACEGYKAVEAAYVLCCAHLTFCVASSTDYTQQPLTQAPANFCLQCVEVGADRSSRTSLPLPAIVHFTVSASVVF